MLWIAIVAGVALLSAAAALHRRRRKLREEQAAFSDMEQVVDASLKKEGGPPA
ncbi:LPXTG cell wall anchor domain-containing protein [Bradyrhizobium sp.]|jgi:LPXTG-motif cell wall-anchored protein|uniref:LPXTG cell wall anchor domain-containing protein n=1 Tax=Bradyrhizobium sp. TaxID=376 RepID=UPI002DDDA78B|nr:LPXTG cell wall anchor domain-containing protein [Bradyrhizobium sp.]HEV2160257.1 LPXTG cell wall anchor domain-containing protein [Bradyrhizobium sp.]